MQFLLTRDLTFLCLCSLSLASGIWCFEYNYSCFPLIALLLYPRYARKYVVKGIYLVGDDTMVVFLGILVFVSLCLVFQFLTLHSFLLRFVSHRRL